MPRDDELSFDADGFPLFDPQEMMLETESVRERQTYLDIRSDNCGRIMQLNKMGTGIPLDIIWIGSMLEFMLISQDLLDDVLEFHQGRLSELLNRYEVMVSRQIKINQRQQTMQRLLTNGQAPPAGPSMPIRGK